MILDYRSGPNGITKFLETGRGRIRKTAARDLATMTVGAEPGDAGTSGSWKRPGSGCSP